VSSADGGFLFTSESVTDIGYDTGDFGRDEAGFTWENTDKAAVLRAEAGLA
jgi:hypothetical protein